LKTFLAGALILAAVLAAVSLWGMVHARRMGVSSSQIFIHGTPVCVTQRGGEIETAIGECGSSPGLPPGHPPVGGDPDLFDGAARRIPI